MLRLKTLRLKNVAISCGLLAALLLLAGGFAAIGWLGQFWLHGKSTTTAQSSFIGDYFLEADWGIGQAATGHLLNLFASPGGFRAAPLMMPFSLLIRAAVDAVAAALGVITLHSRVYVHDISGSITPFFHVSDWNRYRVGSLGVLFVGSALMLGSLGLRPARREVAAVIAGTLAVLLVPLSGAALFLGHPEEALEAFLVFSGLMAARAGRWKYSAVMFGLAVATKQPSWLLVPMLPFLFPRERVWKLLGLTAAVAGVVVLPFVLPHMGIVTGAQTTQIGASAGTSTQSMLQSVWGAFFYAHIGNLTSWGRPLTLLLALAIPVIAASRSGWKLSVVQAAAVASLVLLLRAALDPFNASYYAAPAGGAMIALEMIAWLQHSHPFDRQALLRRLWPVPVWAIAANLLLMGVMGGFVEHWLGTLTVSELVLALAYLFINALIAAVLIVVASGVEMRLTRTRKRVYGGVGTAIAACVLAMTIIDHAKATRTQIAPPPGYAAASPQRLATLGLRIYWLGDRHLPENMYVRVSALGSKTAAAYTFFDYGASAQTLHTVSVFNIVEQPTSRVPGQMKFCESHARACASKKLRIVATPLGRGLLETVGPSGWNLYVLRGKDIVYVTSTLAISPSQIIPLLQPLVPAHQRSNSYAATLVGGGS